MSKGATKKQLLESIASLQASLKVANEGAQALIRKTSEQAEEIRSLEMQCAQMRDLNRITERDLADASARVEAYEFVLRLHFKVEKPVSSSDGPLRPVVPTSRAHAEDNAAKWNGMISAAMYGRGK